jgi:hypothetical protein
MFSEKRIGNKSLVYTSSVRPFLEYVSASWDPCKGEKNALEHVQKKAAQFTFYTNYSNWETVANYRSIARLCALYKGAMGKVLWKLHETGCDGFTI